MERSKTGKLQWGLAITPRPSSTCFSISIEKLACITALINGNELQALIDSVLSKSLIKRTSLPEKMRVTPIQERVALAYGKHYESQVELKQLYFITTLYVVEDLATDVFLEADFLTDHDVTVEYGRHCLYIDKSAKTNNILEKRKTSSKDK